MSNNSVLAQTGELSPVWASTLLFVHTFSETGEQLADVERNAMSSCFAGFCIVYVFITNFDLVWLCMCRVYYGRHCDCCSVQWKVCY